MLEEGSVLNEFRLLKALGSGAFGEVWLAQNPLALGNEHDPERVALKIPFQHDEDIVSEGKNLASLAHPNIVRIYRIGKANEQIFLVMEYMPGGNLLDKLKNQGQLSEAKAIEIVMQILQALTYLHGQGGVHMDIKPNNILFDANGTARLADFGITQFVDTKSYIYHVGGTHGYAAPEVYRTGRASKASDLWSVGIVLHELLAGHLPFQASTPANLMYKILHDPPSIAPDISAAVQAVILKTLEKDTQTRYRSSDNLMKDLEAVRQGPDINSINMVFVPIPAGEFLMGSNDGGDNEQPVHTIHISQPFVLGKYPVTYAQWQAVMGGKLADDLNRPVTNISWDDIQRFLHKLNTQEGGREYRLPTEAEWEYACRAGSTAAYSFGDDPKQLGEYAWYGGNSGSLLVGQRKPNVWGLYDMHGNVWEVVQDWYNGAYYQESVGRDPQGPAQG